MNGGSLEFLGDTLPGIVSPETLYENIEFYYVSAHGRTNLSEYYVVPENTFVFYLGFSGFVKISGREDHPDLDRMLFPGGYDSVAFDDSNNNNDNNQNNNDNIGSAQEQREYWKELYENFVTGTKRSYRLYPKASIYVPGDIVPQTILSFNSDFSDFWRKGVFTLPIRQDLLDTFTRAERHETMTQFMLIDNKGHIPAEFFTNAVFKEGKEAEWQALKVDDEAELSKEQEKAEYWFEDPSAFSDFVNDYLRKDDDNLVQQHNIPLTKNRTKISKVIDMIPTDKKYRFFIVTSCRTPYNIKQEDKIYFSDLVDRAKYMYPNPLNLPATIKPQYRIARRASFAAKHMEEDVCSHTQEPAMNFLRVNAILHEVLDTQIFEKYLAEHEDIQIHRLVEAIRPVMDASTISVSHLARLLDVATVRYTLIENPLPELKSVRDLLVKLLSALQVAFGFFIYGLHQDKSIQANHALKTAGEWLMEHSVKTPQPPLYAPNRRNALAANQLNFISRNTYTNFEASNMRHRIEPTPEEVDYVHTVEQNHNALWKQLNTIQSSVSKLTHETAGIALANLIALKKEYDTTLTESISNIESIKVKYSESYKKSAEDIVITIKPIVLLFAKFPTKYEQVLKAVQSKMTTQGGMRNKSKRTRKQKRNRCRKTRRFH